MRVGVIGAGVMGTNHARVLGNCRTTVVGIVDPLPEYRLRATEQAGCRAFETLEQLVAEGVDAVTIAAPTHLHHEIALACIERKIRIRSKSPSPPRWTKAARSSQPPRGPASR
jgi:predicted dehydrogenase